MNHVSHRSQKLLTRLNAGTNKAADVEAKKEGVVVVVDPMGPVLIPIGHATAHAHLDVHLDA